MVRGPLNLTKTQNGYVPLSDRFKSLPADAQNEPKTDERHYFDSRANSTLERADIGLLFKTPLWLRRRLNKTGLNGFYFTTGDGKLLIINNKYSVGTEEA